VCLGIRKSRNFPAASLVSSVEFACLRNNFMNSQFRFEHLKVRSVTAVEEWVSQLEIRTRLRHAGHQVRSSSPSPKPPFFSLCRIWFWVPHLSSRPCTFPALILASASFPLYYQELDLMGCIAVIWIVCFQYQPAGQRWIASLDANA